MADDPTKSLIDEIDSLNLDDEFSENAVSEDRNVAKHKPYDDFHDFFENESEPPVNWDDLLDTENEPPVITPHYISVSASYVNLDDILDGELLDILIGKNSQHQNVDDLHDGKNNSHWRKSKL